MYIQITASGCWNHPKFLGALQNSLLRYIVSKIDQTTDTAADILKSVNVLKAI